LRVGGTGATTDPFAGNLFHLSPEEKRVITEFLVCAGLGSTGCVANAVGIGRFAGPGVGVVAGLTCAIAAGTQCAVRAVNAWPK